MSNFLYWEFEEMTRFTGFQRARRSRFRSHCLHSVPAQPVNATLGLSRSTEMS